MLSKYGDHTPLYRQEDILARSGVILRRSTLCDWVASASELLAPLYLLMIRRVLQSKVIHTDDTTVKLLDPEQEKSITARFWAYLGDFQYPYVVYDFTDSRRAMVRRISYKDSPAISKPMPRAATTGSI